MNYELLICAAIVFLCASKALGIEGNRWSQDDESPSCESSPHYRYYGSKTDYLVSTGAHHEDIQEHEGCQPIQLYFFTRHAIRYPHAHDSELYADKLLKLKEKIMKLHNERKNILCDSVSKGLYKWKVNMEPWQEDNISESGKKQSHNLALRLKERFPSLLNISYKYNKDEFDIRYSSKRRAFQTASAFTSGLFKETPNLKGEPNDQILQFHVKCEEILQNKGWSRENHAEEEEFTKGYLTNYVLRDLSERITFNISFEEAFALFQTCAFEYAFYGNSVWCALFSEEDIKAFEYLDDLRDYYSDGYGYRRNYEQACPAIGHIVQTFRQALKGDHPRAVLMFSHGRAVKKLATSFSLFKDERPIKASEFHERGDRRWRSSFICPFNSNFVFVLYRCSQGFSVETLFNEKPVTIKGCRTSLCPWEDFEKALKEKADNCDFESICSP